MRAQNKTKKGRARGRTTDGAVVEINKSSRNEYFIDNALEITPDRQKILVASLGRPVISRRLKYNLQEQQLLASHLNSATGTSLVNISQGTSDITRTGDRVRVKRITLGGKISGSATATSSHIVRVLVYVDKGNANPTAGSILNSSSSYLPLASYGRDYGDLFQVIFDEVVNIAPTASTTPFSLLRMDRKVNIDMGFNAGGTSPIANNIRVLVMCDATGNFATLTLSSTLWYEDLDA